MSTNRVAKIIRVGTSLAIVLPAGLCRELGILRGSLFEIMVNDANRIMLTKIRVVSEEDFGEPSDLSVPIIKNG